MCVSLLHRVMGNDAYFGSKATAGVCQALIALMPLAERLAVLAAVNTASLRSEFDALKARFEALCADGEL